MDSLIVAAARALSAGDPLGALKRISLREDAAALALRGIAMAQLGEFERARALLRKAARAFSAKEVVARAKCLVAEAEIALACRDLDWSAKALAGAGASLEKHGDWINASHARYLDIRRLVLQGRLDEAERGLIDLDVARLPAALKVTHELIVANIAMRRVEARSARAALDKAERVADGAGIPALNAEVESASAMLQLPAARLVRRGAEKALLLEDVEDLFASSALLVDSCRYVVCLGDHKVNLTRRPVLFALARTLAERWPADVSRDELVSRVFRLKRADESLRARLRVEMGRLRTVLRALADVKATTQGYLLQPHSASDVAVLAQPVENEHASLLAMLADGESWSSSALAPALGSSQRKVQRALESLANAGKVQHFGHGRARRWMTPPGPGIATMLLLPSVLPGG